MSRAHVYDKSGMIRREIRRRILDRIRIMESHGRTVTQMSLAENSGLSQPVISGILNHPTPPLEGMIAVAKTLKIDLSDIFDFSR